jgi:hypothetical protein
MKKVLLALWILSTTTAFLMASPIHQGRKLGLGLVAGEPSGLSWKYWQGSTHALDGALAISSFNDYFAAHVNYLWHNYKAIKVEQGKMPLYYGVGGALWSGTFHTHDGANLGVRGVVGLEYVFDRAPFDLFLELAPTMYLVPESGLWLHAGLGGRFYF